jgi:two-component system cell cycle sensor histidine kinase/response regulator CckA
MPTPSPTPTFSELLLTIIERIPVRVFWKDRDSRYLGCNAAFARDAGLASPAEVVGRTDDAFQWDAQAALYRADDRAIIDSGLARLAYEEPQTTRDGRKIWLRTSKVPLHDARGETVIGVLGMYEDITAERAAREILELDHLGNQRARDGICWIDEAGAFHYMNDAFAALVGVDPGAPGTVRLVDVVPSLDAAAWAARWATIVALGAEDFELAVRGRGGFDVPVEVSANFVAVDDRRLVVAFVRNITRRKAYEAELLASEDRFRALIDQSPLATQIIEPGGETVRVNAAWEALWGVPFAAMAGYNMLEDEQLRARGVMPLVERAFAGEPVVVPALEYDRASTREVPSGGGKIWVRTLLYPVHGQDGALREIVLLHDDLTDRMRAEAALSESELRFRTLFDQSPDPCWILGDDHRFVLANRAAVELFGAESPEALHGRHPLSLSPRTLPDGGAALERARELLVRVETLGTQRFEWVHRRLDGTDVPVELTVARIEMAGQRRFYCVARDISARKISEARLRSSHDFQAKIIAGASEGVSVCYAIDEYPFVRFSVWNDRMTQITGYTLEEINTLGWYQSMYPDPDTQRRAMVRMDRMRDGDHLAGEPWEITTRDGEHRTLLMSTSLIRLEDGREAVVGLMHDVTDLRRAEAEQVGLRAQLAASQRLDSVGRLAGGVAHDFNNMLGVILGRTMLAMEQLRSSDPVQADLKEVLEAAQRSAELTKQLLAFARRQPSKPVELDLNEKVGGLLKMLRRLIGEDIALEWVPGGHAPVRVDPTQIDQILTNLCVNARDAIAGIGTIRIETACVARRPPDEPAGTPPRSFVMLSVSDTGAGMNEEVLANLFEPFYTTKGVGQGTGLGLATVYGIIKQNGGHVEVSSRPGQGTHFCLYLPALAQPAMPEVAGATSTPPARGTETILLVEDEPSVMRLTRRILERLGYTVLAAESPTEALRQAREHTGPIDLLLTDVIMPEMSGWDLSQVLVVLRPETAVLFMSGYSADVLAPRGVPASDFALLQKPFGSEALAARVREVLGGRRHT